MVASPERHLARRSFRTTSCGAPQYTRADAQRDGAKVSVSASLRRTWAHFGHVRINSLERSGLGEEFAALDEHALLVCFAMVAAKGDVNAHVRL